MTSPRLYSVGHSNHELARLLQLLKGAEVTAVADVRSVPFSARCPQFNGPELERTLKQGGFAYFFLGEELGGRPRDPDLYDEEGHLDYERVRKTFALQQGLDRLCQVLERFAVAMLCSEEDPLDCHRALLIAPAMLERGIEPSHIRADGSLQSTAEFEDRLLAETKVGTGILDGLFAATMGVEERQRLLAEAYRLRALRKAFRVRPDQRSSHAVGGED